jgi:hypothetical protein
MFLLDMWNMHTRAEDRMSKTNNSFEGWHRSFQSNMGCCNPRCLLYTIVLNFKIYLRHLFMKICIFVVLALETLPVSASYSKTVLAFELNVLIFVVLEMAEFFDMGRGTVRAQRALLILARMSSSVPPDLLILLPR